MKKIKEDSVAASSFSNILEMLLPVATDTVSIFGKLAQSLANFIEEGNNLNELNNMDEWKEFNIKDCNYDYSYSDVNGELKVMYKKKSIDSVGFKVEDGNTVTVYSRYLFAVPVRGIVMETTKESFKVDFFTNNKGGSNVNKHDGSWFLKGQCKVDEMNKQEVIPPEE